MDALPPGLSETEKILILNHRKNNSGKRIVAKKQLGMTGAKRKKVEPAGTSVAPTVGVSVNSCNEMKFVLKEVSHFNHSSNC